MICYKDMTFCSDFDVCATKDCHRQFTQEERERAEKWWGGKDFPVAWSSFKNNCESFKPIGAT